MKSIDRQIFTHKKRQKIMARFFDLRMRGINHVHYHIERRDKELCLTIGIDRGLMRWSVTNIVYVYVKEKRLKEPWRISTGTYYDRPIDEAVATFEAFWPEGTNR